MKRIALMVLVAVLALVAVSAASARTEFNFNPQVTICHKPGTPAERTMTVSLNALFGHLGHGDYLGPCQDSGNGGGDGGNGGGDNGGGGGGDNGGGNVTPPAAIASAAPTICADGLPPDAGLDGWVPADGNTNDNCDHSGDPRLNGGIDTRTRWPGY